MTQIARVSATEVDGDGVTSFQMPTSVGDSGSPEQTAALLQQDGAAAVGTLTGGATIEHLGSGLWQVNWSWSWTATQMLIGKEVEVTFDPVTFSDSGSYTTESEPDRIVTTSFGGDVVAALRDYHVIYTGTGGADHVTLTTGLVVPYPVPIGGSPAPIIPLLIPRSATLNSSDSSTSDPGIGSMPIPASYGDALAAITDGFGGNFVDTGGGDDHIVMGAGLNYVFAGDGDDEVTGSFGNQLHGGAGVDAVHLDLSGAPGSPVVFSGNAETVAGQSIWIGTVAVEGFEVFDVTCSDADDTINLAAASLRTSAKYGESHFALGGGKNTVLVDSYTQGRAHVSLTGGSNLLAADLSNVSTAVTLTDSSLSIPGYMRTLGFNLSADGHFDSAQVTGGSADDLLFGTSGNDTLSGGAGNDTIVGGAGDDILTGGSGADLFIVKDGDGADTITDFAKGDGDRIDLSGISAIRGFADLVARMTQVDADTRIDLGSGTSLLLKNVDSATLTSSQFIFQQQDVACFYAGTRITTARGLVPVEALRIGDLLPCLDGVSRPLVWLGRQSVSTRGPNSHRILPIRIKAEALAAHMPRRDLLVSPDHALLIDGNLIAAGALVNGRSIQREPNVPERFTYFHVELGQHAILFAEGAPAESFVDNVDRLHFDNWAEHQALYPAGHGMGELPYPRAKAQRQVPRATRDRLRLRAEALVAQEGPLPQAA